MGKSHKLNAKRALSLKGEINSLCLSWIFLWKHVGQRKSTIALAGVAIEDFYFLKTNQHVFNEKLYVQRGKDFI
jgi:hypothetical protein